ncbi:MAG: DUF3000 family protein [Frankiaceae bacterium]
MQPPSDFDALATRLRDAITDVRADISVYELPAPRRVAPDAVAVGAAVENGDVELAAGRLVLLHDPEGQPAWEGTSRFVCYARAVLDEEMAADPMLPAVTWSWLMEALSSRGAGHRATGGTVTVTSSRRFGALAEPGALLDTEGAEGAEGDRHEVELRCSWTPADSDVAAHLLAFADLLALMSGLPPRVSGVVPLSARSGRGR